MKIVDIKPKLLVLTEPDSYCTILAEHHLIQQRRATHGRVLKRVKAHQDAWWVIHTDDDSLAPYWYHELNLDPEPLEPPRFSLQKE